MKTKLALAILLVVVNVASAHIITIGSVRFTGTFTLNHLYSFNNPSAQPFGTFSNLGVVSSGGIFSPYIQVGDIIPSQPLWTAGNLPLFSLGGFTFATEHVLITGADAGRFVSGSSSLSGHDYEPTVDDFAGWGFIAPPYDIGRFYEDITGPINFGVLVVHDNHVVPDGGATLMLLLGGIGSLLLFKRK